MLTGRARRTEPRFNARYEILRDDEGFSLPQVWIWQCHQVAPTRVGVFARGRVSSRDERGGVLVLVAFQVKVEPDEF